nr:ATP-grasp domain-containing protein [Micromonospora sp. DSM 115978]
MDEAGPPRVLLGNFEVEDEWARGEPGLPRLSGAAGRAVVNRMDEFALLLAGPADHVVLKEEPDPDYLRYLVDLGIPLPAVLTPRSQDPQRTVTEDALSDPELTAALSALAATGARLWPHGVSDREERLAEVTGLPLATAAAPVCKTVNSKVYSRLAADQLGLRQPAGMACRDIAEFTAACDQARSWLAAGRPAVVKDAYGVSGKGMVVVTDGRDLDRVERMVTRQARRAGRDEVGLVVEEWVDKDLDLNYQFTVARDGTTRFDFVKEAITVAGVHHGHRMPATLDPATMAQLRETAGLLGRRLAADGYFGVVGVDAMLDPRGGLYPVTEINARNNMSTYQERLCARFVGPDDTALAMRYSVRLRDRLPFATLRRELDGLLLDTGSPVGLVVNNVATLNAGLPAPGESATGGGSATGRRAVEGRLYGLVVAATPDHATALDRQVRDRLADLTRGAADDS